MLVKLQSAMREMAEVHRAALESFEKIRRCIDHVQTLTTLRDLPLVLEGVRGQLGMDELGVILDAAMFGEFLPDKVPTAEPRVLRALLSELPGNGRPYMGTCDQAPYLDHHLDPAAPCPAPCSGETPGSCFIQPLPNKYAPGRPIGVIVLRDRDAQRFSSDKATDFLEHFCDLLGHAVVTVRDHDQLVRDTVIDELTGAHNRHYLVRHAPRLLALAERKGMPLALLFVDLDRFKPVNDLLGHDAGDCVLREAARRMREVVRGYDIFARLGGDEFVVLMPDAGEDEAVALAERLREEVAAVDVAACTAQVCAAPDGIGNGTERKDGTFDGETAAAPNPAARGLTLSASVGLALHAPGRTLDDLLHLADQNMYRAKRAGQDGGPRESGQNIGQDSGQDSGQDGGEADGDEAETAAAST
ncbi:sensor domain-containing diguanylate cyclase [Desulfovibrio sp. X2]|uniref:sensor domain-containing diguanylate cyclase n=1 Tax=Desulfovibrio sp. X2 TaxID=941449 RepID=UPI00040C1002|nr:sensor domain-containing diguanylate cyclase [Desulfovibrio sp. X2]